MPVPPPVTTATLPSSSPITLTPCRLAHEVALVQLVAIGRQRALAVERQEVRPRLEEHVLPPLAGRVVRVLLDDRPRVAEDVRVALELARAVGEHADERVALSRALEVRAGPRRPGPAARNRSP